MELKYEQLKKFEQEDTCTFLKEVSGWNNHRPLLYLALELSKTGDILELGCGEGSTNQLHCYSEKTNRKVISYDFNQEWLDKYKHLATDNHQFRCNPNPTGLIDYVIRDGKCSVCLIDHSPGERRWEDAIAIKDLVDYVVIHDSESAATGYMLDKVFPHYKYRLNNNTIGACATLLSNKVDVTIYNNMDFGGFTFTTEIV